MTRAKAQSDAIEDAVGRVFSGGQPACVTREAMRQAGMAAVGAMAVDPNTTVAQHRARVYETAVEAMHAARYRLINGGMPALAGGMDERTLDLDSAEAAVAIHHARVALRHLPEQMRTLVHMALAGSSTAHMAQRLGIDQAHLGIVRADLAHRLTNDIT